MVANSVGTVVVQELAGDATELRVLSTKPLVRTLCDGVGSGE
jgi:hypothetical protein